MNDKKVYEVVFLVLLLAFVINTKLNAANLIEEYGVNEGDAINNGFVFIEGKYIDSPYIVSRRGLGLYINDKKINHPTQYVESTFLSGYDKPEELAEEEKQKLYRAIEATKKTYEKYLKQGYGYIFSEQGGHLRLSPYTTAYTLPNVIELLTSDKTRSEKLAGLLLNNWHLHINIEPLVDNFVQSSQLSARLSQQAQELLRVNEFGSNSGLSINNGFIFVDGRYLEIPYKVDRKGLGVFINEKMIVPPLEWPIKQFPGDVDPQMPAEISEETSWHDDIVQEYLSKKHAYLRKQNTRNEEEIQNMEEVIRDLPLVVEAQKIDPNRPYILQVKTTEGLIINRSLLSMYGRRGVKYDKDSFLSRVESRRSHYENALSKGACYFLSSKGETTRLSTNSVADILVPMVKTLESDKSEIEKLPEIRSLGINISDDRIKEMINNYSYNQQLRNRLDSIRSDL